MLPIQADDGDYDVQNQIRRRRAAYFMVLLLSSMILLSYAQQDVRTISKVLVKCLTQTLMTNLVILFNVIKNLKANNNPYNLTEEQQQCFVYQLIESVSMRNLRGEWNNSTSNGKFFFQAQPRSDEQLSLRLIYFDGDYLDGRRTLIHLLINQTVSEGIIYNNDERQIQLKDYKTSVQIGDFQDEEMSTDCLVDMKLGLSNMYLPNGNISSQIQVDMSIQTKKCEIEFDSVSKATNVHIDYQSKSFMYSLFMTTIAVIQSISTLRILKSIFESNTQAEHYSLISLALATSQDAYMSILHFYFALSIEVFFHHFITPAFIYFLLFSIFEMRLVIIIYKLRQQNYFDNVSLRRAIFQFYMGYYLLMFTMSYLLFKYALEPWFISLMCLFLVPQVVHNALRGQQQRMDKSYAFGLMASRVLIILYFKGCPGNMFEFKPDYLLCVFVIFLVSIQLIAYYCQEKYGPRFFIPKSFLPKKYNYFVEIPDVIDLEHGASPEIQGLFADECSVCMNPLHQQPELQLSIQEQENPYLALMEVEGKGKIMKTPCDHKFHCVCLAKWMMIKMTCPSCRSALPVL